jgi:hypothetical protein
VKGTVICGRRTLIAAGLVDLVICGWLGREVFRVAGALWTVSDPALAQVLSVCSAEIPESTAGSSRPNKVLVFSDVVERVAVGASPSSSESNRIELKSSALVK